VREAQLFAGVDAAALAAQPFAVDEVDFGHHDGRIGRSVREVERPADLPWPYSDAVR